jgi:hypothetical protein
MAHRLRITTLKNDATNTDIRQRNEDVRYMRVHLYLYSATVN